MDKSNNTLRRKLRVRSSLKTAKTDRARLTVFRSSKHIYAQVIDDSVGRTLASASTLDKDYKGKKAVTKETAAVIGKLVAERAVKAGVKEVYFDRGSYAYHGRLQALADAAREAGLQF